MTEDGSLDELVEERDFLLRSLDDLERERAAGDLDEADYTARCVTGTRSGRPRCCGPSRTIVRWPAPVTRGTRRRAVIAVAVVALALAVGLAVAAAAGSRLPGQTVTGDVGGSEASRLARRQRWPRTTRSAPSSSTTRSWPMTPTTWAPCPSGACCWRRSARPSGVLRWRSRDAARSSGRSSSPLRTLVSSSPPASPCASPATTGRPRRRSPGPGQRPGPGVAPPDRGLPLQHARRLIATADPQVAGRGGVDGTDETAGGVSLHRPDRGLASAPPPAHQLDPLAVEPLDHGVEDVAVGAQRRLGRWPAPSGASR